MFIIISSCLIKKNFTKDLQYVQWFWLSSWFISLSQYHAYISLCLFGNSLWLSPYFLIHLLKIQLNYVVSFAKIFPKFMFSVRTSLCISSMYSILQLCLHCCCSGLKNHLPADWYCDLIMISWFRVRLAWVRLISLWLNFLWTKWLTFFYLLQISVKMSPSQMVSNIKSWFKNEIFSLSFTPISLFLIWLLFICSNMIFVIIVLSAFDHSLNL